MCVIITTNCDNSYFEDIHYFSNIVADSVGFEVIKAEILWRRVFLKTTTKYSNNTCTEDEMRLSNSLQFRRKTLNLAISKSEREQGTNTKGLMFRLYSMSG